jgi:hypothetical protein
MANGASAAVTQATRLQEIGFAEFTTELVTEVFEALIEANVRQTEAYIALLRAASESLAGFIARTAPEIESGEVDRFVAALPEVKAGANLDADAVERINGILALPAGSGIANDNRVAAAGNLDAAKVDAIRDAAGRRIAANQFELLQEMVRQGILRIVIDNGIIETRLTFTTHGSSERLRTSTTRVTDTSSGVGVSGSIGGGRSFLSSVVGRSQGGGFTGGIGLSRQSTVRVSSATARDRDVNGSRVQIFGRVEIRFKTDYVPLNQD